MPVAVSRFLLGLCRDQFFIAADPVGSNNLSWSCYSRMIRSLNLQIERCELHCEQLIHWGHRLPRKSSCKFLVIRVDFIFVVKFRIVSHYRWTNLKGVWEILIFKKILKKYFSVVFNCLREFNCIKLLNVNFI